MEQKLAKACLEFVEIGKEKDEKSNLFTVQFNPAQLKYSISSASLNEGEFSRQIADFQMKNGNVPAQTAHEIPQAVHVTLSMDLIFDSSLKPAEGIQREVEVFLAASSNPLKRRVIFRWNRIRFEGDLTDTATEYTMFSDAGKPLRAKISISIDSNGTKGIPSEWLKSAKKIFHI